MRVKLVGSQTHNCGIDGDDVQHSWCLGPKLNESPEVVLEMFLVPLLTREKDILCKLRTLKTLEVGENLLLQIVPSVNHTRTRERISLCCHFVGNNDEGLHQHGIVTAS
jgi:hypothetical protein